MLCKFTKCEAGIVCENCGRQIANPKFEPHTYFATCLGPERLGDWTERMLASIGVTEERYKAAKEKFGLAPTCGCKKRKEWLNSVSDWWRGQ